MRATLSLVCALTAAAAGYLTLSLAILRPPNANIAGWSVFALLFVAQSVLTLLALAARVPGATLRWVVLAGAAGIVWLGGSWVYATLTGSHFEGYVVGLGSALVGQGVLTLVVFGKSLQRVQLV
jgi:hypothetical protein